MLKEPRVGVKIKNLGLRQGLSLENASQIPSAVLHHSSAQSPNFPHHTALAISALALPFGQSNFDHATKFINLCVVCELCSTSYNLRKFTNSPNKIAIAGLYRKKCRFHEGSVNYCLSLPLSESSMTYTTCPSNMSNSSTSCLV